MKKGLVLLVIATCVMHSCEARKSYEKNITSGITTKGDGLSCEDVYLSLNDNKINNSSFVFGDVFYVNFNNITGFKKEDGKVFPGMQLLIMGKKGDTIMLNKDLYENSHQGFDNSPLLLQTHITVGKPIYSGKDYLLSMKIWDKKGKGKFETQMDFNVVENNNIKIETEGILYDEVYLFSKTGNSTIPHNKVQLNEDIYMIFEGLEGFIKEDDNVFIGLSMKAVDANGETLFNEEDLVGPNGMEAEGVKDQLAPSFIFTSNEVQSPIRCELVIWDKQSNRRIKAIATVSLN